MKKMYRKREGGVQLSTKQKAKLQTLQVVWIFPIEYLLKSPDARANKGAR